MEEAFVVWHAAQLNYVCIRGTSCVQSWGQNGGRSQGGIHQGRLGQIKVQKQTLIYVNILILFVYVLFPFDLNTFNFQEHLVPTLFTK